MKKSLFILSVCIAAFACCIACKQYNNPENPSDPKAEIAKAIQDAGRPFYLDETVVRAKGGAVALSAAGWAIAVTVLHHIAKGGEQEDMHQSFMILFAFNEPLSEVPKALYLGGENGEEPVKVENIEMVTPTLGVSVIAATYVALGVEPILMAAENLDGAPSYLVDLKTIQRMGTDIAVWGADEVENNLEKFENMAFMRMNHRIGGSVQLCSIDQVKKIESDGPGDIFSIEPLVTYLWTAF